MENPFQNPQKMLFTFYENLFYEVFDYLIKHENK